MIIDEDPFPEHTARKKITFLLFLLAKMNTNYFTQACRNEDNWICTPTKLKSESVAMTSVVNVYSQNLISFISSQW